MHPRITLSVSNLFFGFSVGITTYVLLPYLTAFMSDRTAGFVIAAGAALASGTFIFWPRIITWVGTQQAAILLALGQMFALFALAVGPSGFVAAALIALSISLQPFLYYTFDVMLEATVAQETVTGRVRTLFLSAWNMAEIGAPLILGAVLNTGDAYGRVFLAAAAALAPIIIILATRALPTHKPPHLIRVKETLHTIFHNHDLAAVASGHLILGFFYIWAPLYIPLYLHNILGFPWNTLGWIFAIVTLPFLLIEYPAGIIADKYLGDKEMMTAGFIIMGASLAAVSFITKSTSLALIVSILLLSRVGAALVEAMTETHFFRSVSDKDVDTIAWYRAIWPLSALIAPLIGSALLFTNSFSLLFIVTGFFIVGAGTAAALNVTDFR